MAKRSDDSGGDFLGLVALGSMIGNVAQAASRRTLAERHERFRAYTRDLKDFYFKLLGRHRIALREFRMLREDLDHLRRMVERLTEENSDLLARYARDQEEIRRLRRRDEERVSG